MSARGFSLVELLIALTVSSLLVAALVTAMAPARAAFDVTPAALELQQRSRIGLDVLATALRSAGVHDHGNPTLAIAGALVPAAIPVTASGSGDLFSELDVFSPAITGARGVLDRDQPAPSAAMTLGAGAGCPQTPDVCGFMPGTIGAISDGQGRFDIFEVASADVVRMTLTPSRPLSAAYPAGAQVFEIEAFRYALALQPDGSNALVRTTSAGAAQPIVDGVTTLSIAFWGEASAPRITWDGTTGWSSFGPEPPSATFRDARGEWPAGESCAVDRDALGRPGSRLGDLGNAGTLVLLARSLLSDGPWCAAGDRGFYDADLLRLRRIDVSTGFESVAPTLRGSAGQLFSRAGTSSSPMRWVPDRLVSTSISLRHQP